jgi:ribulose-phosphate 3-epimerase
MTMASLSISAFAADVGRTSGDLVRIHAAGADSVHVDVMDGHFVTLTGLGTHWLASMRREIHLPVDVHFMTLDPGKFVPQFAPFGVASMVFHLEGLADGQIAETLGAIASYGIPAGVALSPDSDPETAAPYLDRIERLLVMSSRPGEPGAVFLPDSLKRIAAVRGMADKAGSRARIAVDGCLNQDTALACLESGADTVIMGRAFFRHEDPVALAGMIHNFS